MTSSSSVAATRSPATAHKGTAPTAAQPVGAYRISWARSADDVAAAQHLRHAVFAQEMGARLQPLPGTPPNHDADRFDAFCEHLLLRTVPAADEPPVVVGTYRVMTPAAALRAGGFYSETEFDLAPLHNELQHVVELGRSCVHADHRSGSAVMLMWSALVAFVAHNGLRGAIGCASVSMRDGGHYAASLWQRLRSSHLVDADCRVQPRLPLPVDDLDGSLDLPPPTLIRGYLACGARLLGPPSWDPHFNTADLPLWVRLCDLPLRYRRHLPAAGNTAPARRAAAPAHGG
jgi:putative hemolysin